MDWDDFVPPWYSRQNVKKNYEKGGRVEITEKIEKEMKKKRGKNGRKRAEKRDHKTIHAKGQLSVSAR